MADKSVGTHMGHIDADQRVRRRAKNARNRARRGQAFHDPGSQRRGQIRVHGSRRSR